MTTPTTNTSTGHPGKPNIQFVPIGIPPTLTQLEIICQICSKKGHDARTCSSRGNFANVAEAVIPNDDPADPHWFVDSGATHHMTHDALLIWRTSGHPPL